MIKKLKSSSPCEIMSCSLKHHKMSPDAAKTQENSDICCSRNQSLLATSRPPSAPPAAAAAAAVAAAPARSASASPSPSPTSQQNRLPLPELGDDAAALGPRSPTGRAAAGAGQGLACHCLGGGGWGPSAPHHSRPCLSPSRTALRPEPSPGIGSERSDGDGGGVRAVLSRPWGVPSGSPRHVPCARRFPACTEQRLQTHGRVLQASAARVRAGRGEGANSQGLDRSHIYFSAEATGEKNKTNRKTKTKTALPFPKEKINISAGELPVSPARREVLPAPCLPCCPWAPAAVGFPSLAPTRPRPPRPPPGPSSTKPAQTFNQSSGGGREWVLLP